MFSKEAIISTLLTSGYAFSPTQFNGRPVTVIRAAEPVDEDDSPAYVASKSMPFLEYPPNLAGYVGDVGFDPFRFSDFVPVDFLREAELKHGRICQLAVLGFAAVDSGFRIYPLPDAYQGLTSVTAHDALVEQGAMSQLFLWIGLTEIIGTVALVQMLQGSGRQPGDFNLGTWYLSGMTEEEVNDMKLKEITHCRLAMMAFSGMVTQAVLTQGPFPYV
jgi:light-harvesting complex I chlorophyll a/b binding protein 1